MDQVYGSTCTVIFTGCMNHRGVPETSQIFRKRFPTDRGRNEISEPGFKPKLGTVANHRFRQRHLLNQKKPMEIGRCQFLGHAMENLISWDNVKNRELFNAICVI